MVYTSRSHYCGKECCHETFTLMTIPYYNQKYFVKTKRKQRDAMKKLIITFLLSLIITTGTIASENMTISTSGSNISMIAYEVLKVAYTKLNISLSYEKYPAERALISSNKGLTTGETARVKGIEKKYNNLIIVPVPLVKVEWIVVSKDKTFEVNGWQSLKPYTIGFRQGIKLAETKTKGMKTELVAEDKLALKKLIAGRNDVAVMPRITALSILKEESIKGLTILEPPLESIFLFHYLHKSKEYLLNDLTKILQEMETSGEIRTIRVKLTNRILNK